MILIIGGTSEGRKLAAGLGELGVEFLLTTVGEYAKELAGGGARVRAGQLDPDSLDELVARSRAVIDASHPFATAISAMALDVCERRGVPLLRYERPAARLPENAVLADDAEDAAWRAVDLAAGGVVFLTIGTKTLGAYLAAAAGRCRVVARVLPNIESLAACEKLGMRAGDIIAVKGPTSAELDTAIIRHFNAAVLVTKESGGVGGVEEKIAAAAATAIPLVVVRRPPATGADIATSVEEALAFAKRHARETLHPTVAQEPWNTPESASGRTSR